MRYVMKINKGYVNISLNKVNVPTITVVQDINKATICSQEHIQAIGQDVYNYAKEIHSTLVEVIIVL